MPKDLNEQIKELVSKSKKILITTKVKFGGDELATALALANGLKKLNKNPEIIIDGFEIPNKLSFLSGWPEIKAAPEKMKKFLINLDISQTGIEELSYDVQGDNLKIFLTPKRGVFNNDDLKFETSIFTYDLIFTVGASELETLGKLYDDHRDLFFQIPVINIDHRAANEQFGHLNLVDLTATSSAEMIYNLFADWPEIRFDQILAELLLTGMIDATNCFRDAKVTPKTLETVSQLINLGANRQAIIKALYQTKTINTLKVWGKILSNLQADGQVALIWSKISWQDLADQTISDQEIYGVIDELIINNPTVKIFVLFYQTNDQQTKVIARSLSNQSILELTRDYNPQGDRQEATFTVNQPIEEIEKNLIPDLVEKLK